MGVHSDIPNRSSLDEEIIEVETDTTTTTSTNSCSAESDSMERVLKVLGDMSEVTELLLVRINKELLTDIPRLVCVIPFGYIFRWPMVQHLLCYTTSRSPNTPSSSLHCNTLWWETRCVIPTGTYLGTL